MRTVRASLRSTEIFALLLGIAHGSSHGGSKEQECPGPFYQFDNALQPNAVDQPISGAGYPVELADIVIGTEADWGKYNFVKDGLRGGFDIDLTGMVCAAAGVKCAIVTVPWQSVWPKNYDNLGWVSNPKTYPGIGANNAWFHCSSGTRNMIARQQSTAFTDPYTDASVDTAGFVVASADTTFPADASSKKIGILAAQAYTVYFKSQMGASPLKFNVASSDLMQYDSASAVWAALKAGTVHAVYTGKSEADEFIAANTGYTLMHAAAGWSQGVAYGCRPEHGQALTKLNQGLRAVKATQAFTDLCAKYPEITCDTANTQFTNSWSTASPAAANHPTVKADIVIGTEADWGQYNYIKDSVLGGFDIELTQAVCAAANVNCAIVTVPWQSVWPKNYNNLGHATNSKTYPGIGSNNGWFHCSVGTRNIIARQQSTAFTDPYTDASKDTAGFVVLSTDTMFPADGTGKKVGILAAQAFTVYFKSQMGAAPLKFATAASDLMEYNTADLLWAALKSGTVHAVYTGKSEADNFVGANSGYTLMHAAAGWSAGVAYGCRPEHGQALSKLNAGLRAFKKTTDYTTLCNKYASTISCDTAEATFSNAWSAGSPATQTHPSAKADIVIGTEADWGNYNYIKDSVLGGFDIELTQKVCEHAGVSCAIVTVPWQSVWPKNYNDLGWTSNPKTYPGIGSNNAWFHCSVGTRNMIARQQSTAFTDSYTNAGVDTAGFVTLSSDTDFPANGAGKKIGILAAQAYTVYFKSQMGAGLLFAGADLTEYDSADAAFAALKSGTVHAVYTGASEAAVFTGSNTDYTLMHAAAGWSAGVAYGCRPEHGHAVALLNNGLRAFKKTTGYTDLCAKYASTITCDTQESSFDNMRTAGSPATANHPLSKADLVIGTEADWGQYNYIKDSVLGGFDIELTEALCKHAGLNCAIVTVPWQSVWPKSFTNMGWTNNPKAYPGVGSNNAWFHCSSGTRNIIARQQSTSFTDSYTDYTVDEAGFVVKSNEDFPSNGAGKKVAILAAQAFTHYFKANNNPAGPGTGMYTTDDLMEFDTSDEVWGALKAGDVHAVYTGKSEADDFISKNSGYTLMHAASGWSNGVAFGCRPEFGHAVALLNNALRAYKKTDGYTALCNKYVGAVACDGCSDKPPPTPAPEPSPSPTPAPTDDQEASASYIMKPFSLLTALVLGLRGL